MHRTLRWYLAGYLRGLTGLESDSLKKHLAAVLGPCPSAKEALLAWAVESGKRGELVRLAKESELEPEYAGVLERFDESGLSWSGFLGSEGAPVRYRKVWNGYMAKETSTERDREILAGMSRRISELLAEQGRTRYSIVKELGVNKGNLYAFLAGNTGKMGFETADSILRHLEGKRD